MNKKILLYLLILAIQMPVSAGSYLDKQLNDMKKNSKYSSVKRHAAKYTLPVVKDISTIELKDPKLISLSDLKPVNQALYNAKIASDNIVYKTKIIPAISKNMNTYNVQPMDVDFYKVYRIAERLIRANNLDYMNWRIAIRKSEDEFNAATSEANYIFINTALYDSLYTNDDALAFIIAHEMAHQILGHPQRMAELSYRYQKIIKKTSIPNDQLVSSVGTIGALVQQKRMLAESRMMEYMADAEGAMLMTRAGFEMDKGMEALNFMNALPHVKTLSDTHPMPEKRIESMRENISAFAPEWVNEGKFNIMNSDVLNCKKSSDRVSIIISKSNRPKDYYETETVDKRLARIAYINYRNRNMPEAIKYFKKLADTTESYVPYLYISYANEFLYKQTGEEKYIKRAINAVNIAKKINSTDKYVIEQAMALAAL